jgi:hypothetical protein
LAQQLCGIEELWQHEDGWPAGGEGESPAGPGRLSLDDSLGQLDLLLEEIRLDQAS